jgi:hypothetical protein
MLTSFSETLVKDLDKVKKSWDLVIYILKE